MLPYLKMLGTTPLPSTQDLEVQGLLPLPSLTSHRKVCRTLGCRIRVLRAHQS